MTQFSHSRVETFSQCSYKYKLRYLDKVKMLDNYEPANAFIIGTAMHLGIETNIKDAISWYYSQYPIITDEHINEAMKLEAVIKLMKEQLPPGGEFEVEINDPDFVGYIDYLVEVEPNIYDLYDFKYSNNIDRYLNSDQLHLYKYYFEKNNPLKTIRNLNFMFGPKVQLKQKYKNKTNKFDEDIYSFRKRFMGELATKEVTIKNIKYNPHKVFEYLTEVKHCLEATEFNKNQSKLCYFCEYRAICEDSKFYEIKESEEMNLPSTERRIIKKDNYKKIWIYGAPFSGKTTCVDKAPTPVNLNTDGNIKYVTMPVIPIKDKVEVEGRQTITTKAWDIFKDAVDTLAKKQNNFETIVVDLLEDTYEYCRLYMYDKLDITHESDSGFGKGYDIITTEFLSTLKKLLNLEYNIVLISHEDTTKDLTKKSGDKITAIRPNIKEKLANKIAGMVDIVARVVIDGDSRTLNFKSDEVIFGGGRLSVAKTSVPLDWEEIVKIYDSQKGVEKIETKTETNQSANTDEENEEEAEMVREEKTETIEPAKRKRKSRSEKLVEELTETIDDNCINDNEKCADEEIDCAVEQVPKRRRRSSEE